MRLVVVVALVLLGHVARADDLALVSEDPELRAALTDAGNHVVVTTDPPPALADLPARSKEIAARVGARSTVWLVTTGTTSTLFIYDLGVDQFIARALPYAPPLDAAKATETARMVRTMLASIRVSAPTALPPASAPAPVAIEHLVVTAVEPEPRFALGIGGGVWLAAPAADAQPSGTVFAAWRPHELGAQVSATIAPSASVDAPAFMGDIRDVVVAAQVRNALAVGPRLDLVPAFGAALHIVHVRGDSLDSRRLDPAARISLAALYDLGHGLDAGIDVSADCLLRRQSYQAGTQEILVVPRVQIMTSLVVGIRL